MIDSKTIAPTRPAGAGYAASHIGHGHANDWPHEAALAIVGLPCAECRYRSDACSKIRRNDLGT